jgi:deazaflavin-dependent oxidoreductase (nitroreductase family)
MGDPTGAWRRMNEPVIRSFRSSGGTDAGRKHPVILLTTTGRRSGRSLVTPLNFTMDGDRVVVNASAGGATRHPDWYLNLVANPRVTLERGGDTYAADAETVAEPERTRLYDQQAAVMPFFNGYRNKVTAREIPVVAFTRATDPDDSTR